MDASLAGIHAAGARLMSYSGLRYEGRVLDVGRWTGVHVMEFGSGKPMVLLHGAGSGGAIWHRQIAALAQTRRVIVPDIPMFGITDLPDQLEPPRAAVAALVNLLLDALDVDRADIAGMSLGGLCALGAVLHSPHRFGRLALVSSAGLGADLPYVYRLARVPVARRLLAKPFRRSLDAFFNRMEAQMSSPSPERSAFMDYQYEVSQRRDRGAKLIEGIRDFSGWRGQADVVTDEELSSVSARTLVVWGRDDRFFPVRHAERAADLIADAELRVFERCGHVTAVDAPQQLTDAMVAWFGDDGDPDAARGARP